MRRGDGNTASSVEAFVGTWASEHTSELSHHTVTLTATGARVEGEWLNEVTGHPEAQRALPVISGDATERAIEAHRVQLIRQVPSGGLTTGWVQARRMSDPERTAARVEELDPDFRRSVLLSESASRSAVRTPRSRSIWWLM